MTKFYEIFSKRPSKIIKEKSKIIIDYREKNSLVPSMLVKLGYDLEFKELKIADYLVNGVAIERKTISDFISSMINKRLLKQIEELKQYQDKLLIIEGYEEQEFYNDEPGGISGNAIRGFLLSITLKHGIPIVFSKNANDTAKFIEVIAKKKKEEDISLKAKKRALSKKEQLQFILEGFPGIGPKTAKKLLKKFKTLKSIFNVNEEELKKLVGKKAEIFKLLKEKY